MTIQPFTKTKADTFMAKGIAEAEQCRTTFQQTKQHAINAGFYFRMAREHVKEGNFCLFLDCYKSQIGFRTVYRYIEFTEAAFAWALSEKPELEADINALFTHAKQMVMQSPKPYISLMRQLGEMRKFGEYDAIKYQQRKLLGAGDQLELKLDFSKVFGQLDVLNHIDDTGARLQLLAPDGKSEAEALAELEQKLEVALIKVQSHRRQLQAIDIGGSEA